jgi:phenylalanine-4-hydroxylase
MGAEQLPLQHSPTMKEKTGLDRELSLGGPRSTVLFQTVDEPGALESALRLFWKHSINMTRIESKPTQKNSQTYDFIVDFEGTSFNQNTIDLLQDLHSSCAHVEMLDAKTVPWFPTSLADLDYCVKETLDAGAELESDHPGFNDDEYRNRRKDIADWAFSFKNGDPVPRINYTDTETATWGAVYNKLQSLIPKYACKEYLDVLPKLEKFCGCRPDNIPQVRDISDFLGQTTGWRMRPVAGLLSARNFLNGLAFKTFFSTQYIRHHSMPLYTPEPDICHELLGHAPMFGDPEFAEFSHEIGLASLGASDSDIMRLATCYWFSVEFGLCYEDGKPKAYGAGLLSSFGELEYSCADYRPAGGTDDRPEIRRWIPEEAATQAYPITTYQPIYYCAESMEDAKLRMKDFCANHINRPFGVRYLHQTNTVEVDRAVRMETPSDDTTPLMP